MRLLPSLLGRRGSAAGAPRRPDPGGSLRSRFFCHSEEATTDEESRYASEILRSAQADSPDVFG